MGWLTLARRLYLDANVFIDLLEGVPDRADRLRVLFAFFKTRPMQTVTSEFVLAEIMGKESRRVGWQEQSRFFLDLIVRSGFIDLRQVSREILWATGTLRREARLLGRSLALADSIHIASAIRARCDYVLSADQRLPLPLSLQRLDPHHVDLEQIEQLLDA